MSSRLLMVPLVVVGGLGVAFLLAKAYGASRWAAGTIALRAELDAASVPGGPPA